MLKSIFFLLFIGCTKPATLEVEDSQPSDDIADVGFNPPDCGYSVGDIACNFELLNSEGTTTSLYDYKDSVIVLDFSTAWCYYCQMAAFDAQTIQDLHESKGFAYITVLVEDFSRLSPSESLLKEWEDHFGITTAPVLAGDHDLLDPAGQLGWFCEAWPTFYFIDRDMRIVEYQRGYSESFLNAMLESLLSD